jgi:imidazolonepropionase-like amidohydrolase
MDHGREFRRQIAAGVPMAMGSDVGPFPHGMQAREFELMVKYGMTPLAALQAGTVNGAKLLGWQDRIGTLKPGYSADLIAVPGNPLTDMESGEVDGSLRSTLRQIAGSFGRAGAYAGGCQQECQKQCLHCSTAFL